MNGFQLTDEQEFVVREAVKWYNHSSSNLFQFTGSAGTGKSVVLNEIVRRLQLTYDEIAPMGYIGASAIVMRRKGLLNARTIHSWLFNPVEKEKKDRNGKIVLNAYFNLPETELKFSPKPLIGVKLILIDEAGAVPMELRREIDRRNIKVIACGDLNQLPPPASNPGYLVEGKIYRLTQIMRQAESSPIIYLAQRASKGLPIHEGYYYDKSLGRVSVLVITQDKLNDEMIKRSEILLCGKNKTRESFNKLIRPLKMGRNVSPYLPTCGDLLICRKNNWSVEANGINLANGLIGTVVNVPDVSGYAERMFTINFLPSMSSVAFEDLKCDYDYFNATTEQRQFLKNDKFHRGEKFEYAYAITTHISQGSQFDHGIYYEEYLNRDINSRLNYTGITRFSNALIYVKPGKRFY